MEYETPGKTLTVSGRTVTLFGTPDVPCPVVWLNTYDNEGGAVREALLSLHAPAHVLAAVQIADWSGEMSPWAARGLVRREPDFPGHADRYLEELTGVLLPAVTRQLPVQPLYHAIAGYSMAGLFAVYALYRTDVFRRAASASGSLWYPGFPEFAASHEMQRIPDAVCLSLGDREARTRDPVMASVLDNTRAFYAHLQAQGIAADFVTNPGNHFQEPAQRMARDICRMLCVP